MRDACSRRLPARSARWSPLAQDQYIEIRTLLSGYLLSAQGDRMLMAHSVEGRFPFLDRNVGALADSLPASYKLRVLDEKHVLKKAAPGWCRPIDPRAHEAAVPRPRRARVRRRGRRVDRRIASDRAVRDAGVFAPALVQQLVGKCRTRGGGGAVLEQRQHGGRRRALDAAGVRPVRAARSRSGPAGRHTHRRRRHGHPHGLAIPGVSVVRSLGRSRSMQQRPVPVPLLGTVWGSRTTRR